MVNLVLKYCVQKELLNLKDSKLAQNFYGNKTGFVRPGQKYQKRRRRLKILLQNKKTGD